MIPGKLLRKFPKAFLVAGIFLGSTAIFCAWWFTRGGAKQEARTGGPREIAEAVPDPRPATLPDRVDRLFLADQDLYDAESGELIYQNWLKGAKPDKVYLDEAGKMILAQTDLGVGRFDLDGTPSGQLTEKFGLSISKDFKEGLFARNGDMWRGDIDWTNFKMSNERQVTRVGELQESSMLGNVILASDNFLVLRNRNKFLRINTANGDLTEIRLPLSDLKSGRSPDGSILMGDASERGGRKVYAYRLEKDEAVYQDLGRRGVNQYYWAGLETCVMLVGGDTILIYSREKNAFNEICRLPFQCQNLTGHSPDGNHIFAYSKAGICLINIESAKVEIFTDPVENFEWLSADTILISNNVPSSETRGTWVKKLGNAPRKLLPDPYLFSRDGRAALLIWEDADRVVFATSNRLFKTDRNGEATKELAVVKSPVARLTRVLKFRAPN